MPAVTYLSTSPRAEVDRHRSGEHRDFLELERVSGLELLLSSSCGYLFVYVAILVVAMETVVGCHGNRVSSWSEDFRCDFRFLRLETDERCADQYVSRIFEMSSVTVVDGAGAKRDPLRKA